MADVMEFPSTVEEFMEYYKVIDTDHVYSNGTEFVPIYRMRQWFDHLDAVPRTKADRIRAMSDEELAELIGDNIDCCICKKEIFQTTECPGSILIGEKNCYEVWLDWLKGAQRNDLP